PIHLSTTYFQEVPGKHKGFEYSRTQNPTRKILEEVIASLEDGEFGLAFSSGCAAAMGVLSLLRPGDEILSSSDIYGGTFRIFEKILRPLGINTRYVFSNEPDEFKRCLSSKTKIVWLETPSNPLLKLYDINQVASIKGSDVILVVDNTFATPYFQKPLNHGADIVLHSSTKYLNGHSDVVGGAIATNNEKIYREIKFYQNAAGAIPSPLDCFLVLRGIKTLHIRMERHFENVKKIHSFLKRNPLIKRVYFPDIQNDPIYRKQMLGFCGIISFEVDYEKADINSFIRSLRIIKNAESLGGVESLICVPSRMTHASMPLSERKLRGISDNLIRLSVGIENVDDLIEDISYALQVAQSSRFDYEI
ncbi:MAG: aminotransferase class I/II-fold pyridoxal phosphate-dependent enzyme, partial [Deltaproteobacteria bacterium]|nr:aminotransferase class I/II-fold pyridoxal phosphate-dependent enzyme [Deltaproteobacteria bacterium]